MSVHAFICSIVILEKLYFYKIWVARKRPWSILITQKGKEKIRLQQAVAGADFRSISNPLSESNPSYMA